MTVNVGLGGEFYQIYMIFLLLNVEREGNIGCVGYCQCRGNIVVTFFIATFWKCALLLVLGLSYPSKDIECVSVVIASHFSLETSYNRRSSLTFCSCF